jgi:hypothetical protein
MQNNIFFYYSSLADSILFFLAQRRAVAYLGITCDATCVQKTFNVSVTPVLAKILNLPPGKRSCFGGHLLLGKHVPNLHFEVKQ